MPVRTPEYMEDRREHIVSATMGCIERLGLASTSLTDVCSAAGISRGALYVHFRSKEEILEAVIDRLAAQAVSALSFDSAKELERALERHVKWLIDPQNAGVGLLEMEMLIACRASPALQATLSAALMAREDAMIQSLRKIQRAGETRADLDVKAAAQLILSFLTGLVTTSLASPNKRSNQISALRLLLGPILSMEDCR